jgi:hypothetical protein
MKINLILVFMSLFLFSCGQNKDYVGIPNDGGNNNFAEDTGATYMSLIASKTYSPEVSNQHDLRQITETEGAMEIVLPETITVLEGNAGNHYVFLDIIEDSNNKIRCYYQGGSEEAYPLQTVTTQEQVDRGLVYEFHHCTHSNDGVLNLTYGDTLLVLNEICLEVWHGDSATKTVVEAKIEVL